MKKITFLRHSKSSWDYNLDDIDRPLNNSGVVKIKKIAELSKAQFFNSDIILIFVQPHQRKCDII